MGITKRLLLTNILICMAFIAITMVVFFSFRHVEKGLTTTFRRETHRIIRNSNMSRKLSRLLSNMSLVVRTFYGKPAVLDNEGRHLLVESKTLLALSAEGELKTSLAELRRRIEALLLQCRRVNAIRGGILDIRSRFNESLSSLDDIVAENLIDLSATGEDISAMEQLSTLIGGYRETFIRTNLIFAELGLEYFMSPMAASDHPLMTNLDDLNMRLRTLSASDPEITAFGKRLINLLSDYKVAVFHFHREALQLAYVMEKIHHQREKLLDIMERTDEQVAAKTREATETLTSQINGALVTNLLIFAGILPIVLFGGVTAYSVKRPIQKVTTYIDRIARGDIPEKIEEDYKGEFIQVKNNLNRLIDATHAVTLLAEKIALGDMEIIVENRSENDRLMKALNRMIQSLKTLQRETETMIRNVRDGRLDIRGNPEVFEGGWRELVGGVNNLIGNFADAVSKSAALDKEMALARRIQTALLPDLGQCMHPDLDIAASMLIADEVGGDFYDILLDLSDRMWIAVGDVSGHGVTPGLIMMMAQTVHATVTANLQCDARDLVVRVNEILYRNVKERLNETHFMTFTAIKYIGEGRFQHAGAHLSMIVHRRKAGACELIRTRGTYLNLKPDISKATRNAEFRLHPGDILVLYTDGLTEAENPLGEMLDIRRFVAIVEKHAHHDPEAMKEMILADVIQWCEDVRADDMTILIVKRKEESRDGT